MSQELSGEHIKKRAEEIEKIYKEYMKKLLTLKKKQANIIDECIKKLEQKKIEELKQRIKSFKK
ncbi:hypothetical protein HYW94_01665 [Candidatus Uhrbacteria bacterium]|nr:hypothetical protein [Candidatus Uhrbacteria bacterium]